MTPAPRRAAAPVTLAGLLLAALLALAGCDAAPPPAEHALHGETMGTTWSVKLFDAVPAAEYDAMAAEIAVLFDGLNAAMSTYIEDSEISRFNRSRDTAWQPVSPALAEIVAQALEISGHTRGAFDVTVAPIVALWGFGAAQKEGTFPDRMLLDDLMKTVGYRHLSARLEPPALRKDVPALQVDLSAIAKGYAVDRVAALVAAHGVNNYLAEVGGELRASGVSQLLRPWRVGVEKPTPGWRETMHIVELKGRGIATSGDYRNFIELDGRRYSHGIDPRTGEPAPYRGASMTVIADTAMEADAWATGLFVLGKDEALAIAEAHGLAVYFIEQAGDGFSQTFNEAFSGHLVLQ
ncbi:MAG: FAD:protein FMN transferase [Gammaproteobacteria bacterium]|nr:FAD:protein FMN transferase [Gammaproteobacteria bacterium]